MHSFRAMTETSGLLEQRRWPGPCNPMHEHVVDDCDCLARILGAQVSGRRLRQNARSSFARFAEVGPVASAPDLREQRSTVIKMTGRWSKLTCLRRRNVFSVSFTHLDATSRDGITRTPLQLFT
jgi:hypothetical protein